MPIDSRPSAISTWLVKAGPAGRVDHRLPADDGVLRDGQQHARHHGRQRRRRFRVRVGQPGVHRREARLGAVADQQEHERQAQDVRVQRRRHVHAAASSSARPARRPSRLTKSKYASTVPAKARAMPTEPIRMYFHDASTEAFERWRGMRMAEMIVVASIATHMRATLLTVTASSIASAKRLPKMRNTRGAVPVRLVASAMPGPRQHGQAGDGGDAARDQRRQGVDAEQRRRARPSSDIAAEGDDARSPAAGAERHRARGRRQASPASAGGRAEQRRQRGRERPRREEPGEEQRGRHLSASAA